MANKIIVSELLADVKTVIQDYHRKEGAKLQDRMHQPTVSESYFDDESDVSDQYVSGSIISGQVLQAYKHQWSPTGGEAVIPMLSFAYPIKVDKQIDGLEQLQRTWLKAQGNRENQLQATADFVSKLIKTWLAKANEEIELNCANAVYVEPTDDDVPGAVSAMFDGFLTVLKKEIANSNITASAVGVFTPETIYDKFKAFYMSVPAYRRDSLRFSNTPVLMSAANYFALFNAWKDEQGLMMDFKTHVKEDGSYEIGVGPEFVRIQKLPSFGTSNRFLWNKKSNQKRLYNTSPMIGNFFVEERIRSLFFHSYMYRGFAYEIGDEVYCNDQE